MTDEQIQKEGQCRECCGPLALDGNCYNSECVLRVATDNSIPLPDAVRAFKDRPSMERELSALRAKCERLEAALIVMGGLVRAAIDGNAATRQDVILQIGRMISQALNEKGEE